MPDRVRVYHPETGEPFDLPVNKAIKLRLDKGWLAQPIDPDAVPLVQTVELADEGRDDEPEVLFPKPKKKVDTKNSSV